MQLTSDLVVKETSSVVPVVLPQRPEWHQAQHYHQSGYML